MPRRASDNQDALPFDEPDPKTEQGARERSEDIEDGRRRPGRPRVWASEAERKRAYRERLAADFAEPDRLRKELRAERKRVAEKDREITRLKRELARAKDAERVAFGRQLKLEAMIATLESKVDDWRSRAQALARKREEERAERDEIGRRRARESKPKTRLELPNKGRTPQPRRRRSMITQPPSAEPAADPTSTKNGCQ